jgi:O-antigen/teichoic acid export membrane protein
MREAVTLLGVLLFSGLISENWVYLIPWMIWIYAAFQVFRFLGIRYKKFKAISAAGVSDSASRGGINILLGFTVGEAFGLIIGGFTGIFLSALILLQSVKSKLFSFALDKKLMAEQARAFRKFPIYDAPSTLFYSFGNQGVVLLMTKFLGEKIVGIYSYTERILITPVSFLSNAFSQVFFQKATERYHNEVASFRSLLAKTMDAFILLGIIPFAIFAYTSYWYIPVLLGDQWLELYKFVYVLSPYIFMIFISSPLGHVLKIINRQEVSLILKIIFFSLRFGALFIGYWLHWPALQTLYLFSIFSVLSLMISVISIHRMSGVKISFSVWLLNILNIGVFVVLYFFMQANG